MTIEKGLTLEIYQNDKLIYGPIKSFEELRIITGMKIETELASVPKLMAAILKDEDKTTNNEKIEYDAMQDLITIAYEQKKHNSKNQAK